MGVVVSSSSLCCSFLLTCSSVESHPSEIVLHKLLQCGPFQRAAVLHKLLQYGSFPQSAVLLEQTAPAWVLVGSKVLPANRLLVWAPLSTGPARSLLQCGLPTVTAAFGRICLLWHGVLHRLQLDICSTMDLHRLHGDSLPLHGLSWIAGESLFWCLEHLFPLLLH